MPPPGIDPLLKTKAQPQFDQTVTGRSNPANPTKSANFSAVAAALLLGVGLGVLLTANQ